MKIKNLKLEKLNITALFDKIDQSQITSEAIRDLFKLEPQDKAKTPFIDLPGTKVLVIPTLRKEIVVEPNRIQLSDTSSVGVERSKVVEDFKKIYEAFRGKSKLRAYGFNYVISLQLQRAIPYKKFLSPYLKKLINGGKLLEAGARVVYHKKGRKFDIQLLPGSQERQLGIHANIHREANLIDFTKLAKEILVDYKEINRAIKKFSKG